MVESGEGVEELSPRVEMMLVFGLRMVQTHLVSCSFCFFGKKAPNLDLHSLPYESLYVDRSLGFAVYLVFEFSCGQLDVC